MCLIKTCKHGKLISETIMRPWKSINVKAISTIPCRRGVLNVSLCTCMWWSSKQSHALIYIYCVYSMYMCHSSQEPFYPPKKNSLRKLGGIRSPPGLDRHRNRTGHTGTRQSTGTGSPPGLARRLRLLLGMTRSQGPSQGPSATASTSVTRLGQVAPLVVAAEAIPATCPRRVSVDKTDRIGLKLLLWTQRLKTCLWGHGTALLAVMWTRSKGIGLAAASGHESAPIWRAWVSGDPASMRQRRSGRLELAAIRRALSQRRAGGHWVSGDPVAWSPVNGAPRGAATREPGNQPAGLGEPPPAADISRNRRAWGLAASGLAALAAIPPNSHTDLQWAKAGITSGDFHAAGQTQTQEQNKTLKNENKTRWRGAAYG